MNIRNYLLKLFWCELQGIRYIGIRALTTHMIFKLLLTWYPATSHHQGHQATQASPLNVPSWAVLVKARCGDFYPVSQTMERHKDGELAKVITWFEVEMIFFFDFLANRMKVKFRNSVSQLVPKHEAALQNRQPRTAVFLNCPNILWRWMDRHDMDSQIAISWSFSCCFYPLVVSK